ncbi:MAG: DUF393 domain-containing protein [Planctomycetota bacterium]|nr:MAG: DUF393 domain-containing protein [Planctomycetota bacterium]
MTVAPPIPPTSADQTIVFFDGVCGLCNSTVQFLLTRDRAGQLLFAPLQGETAATRVPLDDRETLNTLVVATPQGMLRQSDAVVHLLRQLPGWWPCCGVLIRIIPRFLRDAGYRFVSRNRYRWFGQHETCRLPTPEERHRFLP